MSTSSQEPLGPGSECTRGRTAVPGDSGPGPRACGFDQLSRATRAWFRRPAGSTNYTGHSGLGWRAHGVYQLSRVTRASVRMPAESTTFPGDSGSSGRVRVVNQAFGRLRPVSEGLWGGPAVPVHSRLHPRARGVDQLSHATGAKVRRASGSTNSPERLGPGSKGPCGGPAVPGH